VAVRAGVGEGGAFVAALAWSPLALPYLDAALRPDVSVRPQRALVPALRLAGC
jgi:hypothetical protein